MSNDPDLLDETALYRVYLTTGATYGVVVEATSAEEAMEKAEMEGAPGLCHHCSSIDLGDWIADAEDVEVIEA